MIDQPTTRTLFLSACAGTLVFGIVFAVLGTVFGIPAMRARLQINLAEQGNLFLLLYLGIFCASLIVGPLIDQLGNRINLLVSSLIVAVAMLAFANASSLLVASFAALLLGLGGGGLNTCTNVLVSDLYGEQRGPMLNLLGIFFGIGALFVPLLAASIEGHFTIAQLFVFCASLAFACALAYALIPFPAAAPQQAFSFREAFEVAKYEGVLPLGFILFFESGNEASIGRWTSTYVNSSGYSPPHRDFGAGRILGRSHDWQNSSFAPAGGNFEISARSWQCLGFGGRMHDSVDLPAHRVISRRYSTDWSVLRSHFSNDASHRRRPLPETFRNGFRTSVFHCAHWRHVASVGGRTSLTTSNHSHGNARAGTWGGWHHHVVSFSFSAGTRGAGCEPSRNTCVGASRSA